MCIFCTSVHYREYTFLLLLGIATEMLVAFLQLQLQGRTWTRSCFLSHTIWHYVIHCSVTVAASDIRDRFAEVSVTGVAVLISLLLWVVDYCKLNLMVGVMKEEEREARGQGEKERKIENIILLCLGFMQGVGVTSAWLNDGMRTISGKLSWSRPLTWNVHYVISF